MTTDRPVEQVERLDAIDCTARGTRRVGDRVSCETHYLEVARAMWNADPRYPMRDLGSSEKYDCGDTYVPQVVAA